MAEIAHFARLYEEFGPGPPAREPVPCPEYHRDIPPGSCSDSDFYWRNLQEREDRRPGIHDEPDPPNPIEAGTAGPDHEKPYPAWVDIEGFEEVATLRKKILDLVGKRSAAEADGKQGPSDAQIKRLSAELERLSSQLGRDPKHGA